MCVAQLFLDSTHFGIAAVLDTQLLESGLTNHRQPVRVLRRQGLELRRGFGWMGSRSTRLLGDQLTKGLTGLKTQVERSPTPDDTPS